VAAFVLTSAAFALEVPDTGLLFSFFKERLTPSMEWRCESNCIVAIDGDSTFFSQRSTISIAPGGASGAEPGNSFALSKSDLFLPIELTRAEPDSVAVNKTRTRYGGIMCWKMKLFQGDNKFDVLVSGDGIFRIMKMEHKPRGSAKSQDEWIFTEIEKGKDIPVSMKRTVDFDWGGRNTSVVSTIEFQNPKAVIPRTLR